MGVDTVGRTFLIGAGAPTAAGATPDALGFKGYNLWRMDRIGLRVPSAFVMDTGFCRDYFDRGRAAPRGLRDLLALRMRDLERASGLVFGSARQPLLVSVRSGAPISMPGMMDTVLDIGMCEATLPGLLRLTGNPRFVWDNYRRFVQSFAEVVHRVPAQLFDAALAARMPESGAMTLADFDFQALRALTRDYLDIFEEAVGKPLPQQPLDQLEAAVVAVWESWMGGKAIEYRRLAALPDDIGTAVTVQRMVFGNAGGTSGAGVAFTRDPASGEPSLYLDFIFNAQGEDVVSGRNPAPNGERLGAVLPEVYSELLAVSHRLEAEFRDMQEFEFTVQNGRLHILQTRVGKRMPWAAVRIAVDQAEEGLIDEAAALERLATIDLARVARSRVVRSDATRVLGRAVSAGAGVAVGEIALDVDRAREIAAAGRVAILVRDKTATDDISGIAVAGGIVTATGGRTSHAAVVARQLNKVCLVGCDTLAVDLEQRRCAFGDEWLPEGSLISLDGNAGEVLSGAVLVEIDQPLDYLRKISAWRAVAKAA